MSNGEIEAVGKELAGHHREKAEVMVKAIANRNRKTLYQQLLDTDDQERLSEIVTALLEYWEPHEISHQLNQH